MASKQDPDVVITPTTLSNDSQDVLDPAIGEATAWEDRAQDLVDMKRLGKKQEFKRNFGFWSVLGFVSIYMATWELVFVSLSVGFANGGFAGLFWCFITTVCCYTAIVASLAEMESMAPTSGGQYHWVSEFAPPQYQRILSYGSGYMSTIGWLASLTSAFYVSSLQIEAMIEITYPDFAFSNWSMTLIMFGLTILTAMMNTYASSTLPAIQTWSLFAHIIGFLVVIIPLWVLCPKNSTYDVFLNFQNNSGYSSAGTAYMVAQVSVMYCILGSDSVVHISEEVKDASLIVPRCMFWSYIYNVFFGIISLITMLYCIGPLDPVINSDVPYLILFNNTGYPGLSIFLNLVLFFLVFAGNITAMAATSREIWAFARDKGLPFSGWIGQMNRKWNVPFNSVYASSVICAILTLVNIGSPLAFNIIVSLILLGLLSTYMVSIGCVLLKRLKGQPLPPARWSLGRYGIFVNGFALFYSAFIIIWCCFPPGLPVDLSSANWAPLAWVAVMVIAVIVYIAHGKCHYTAPVIFVEGKRAAGIALQSS